MIPIARTEKLLIQEVGNELIVYDQENNASHCLNPMAATVWYYCDGNNTINDIAKLLEKELNISKNSEVDMRGLVYLTLEELERYNLIKDYVKQPIGASAISRRTVVKTGVLVGGFAIGSMFPLVKSIVAPVAAQATSPIAETCKRIRQLDGSFSCVGRCSDGSLCKIFNVNGRVSCGCDNTEPVCGNYTCTVKIGNTINTVIKDCPSWCQCTAGASHLRDK